MEELLVNENQSINIAENEIVKHVQASVKVFSDAIVKSKAYYNLLAAESVETFLREKGLLSGEIVNLRSSMKFLSDFEVADIQLANLYIDVRAVFDENELFIPKKHFENKILPDVYLFVKMDEDLQNATMLGFVKPESVNVQNNNGEYYFVNNSILSSIAELVKLIKSTPEKSQYAISGQTEETVEKLIMLYMDSDIDSIKLEKLIDNLKNSAVAREKLVEFENFERLAAMAIQEFKDLDVENNDFSKYIKALVTTDEFAEFEQDDFVSLEQKETTSVGLFIDEEQDIQNESEHVVIEDVVTEEVVTGDVQAFEDSVELPSEVLFEEEQDEDDNLVEPVASVELVDEFDMFDVVDEFDMPDSVEDVNTVIEEQEDSVELLEKSIVNEEDVVQPVVEDLQEEDLELQVEAFSDLANDLEIENVEDEVVEGNVELQEASIESEIVVNDVEDEVKEETVELQEEIVEPQEDELVNVQEEFEEVVAVDEPVIDESEVDESLEVAQDVSFEETENVILEDEQQEFVENVVLEEPQEIIENLELNIEQEEFPELALGENEIVLDENVEENVEPEVVLDEVDVFSEEPVDTDITDNVVFDDAASVVEEIVDDVASFEIEETENLEVVGENSEIEKVISTESMEDILSLDDVENSLDGVEEVVAISEPELELDVSFNEDEISDIPDVIDVVNEQEGENAGVVVQDISFEEEVFDGISDIVEKADVDEEVEDVIGSFDDDIFAEETSETSSVVESVSDAEVDEAIAQAEIFNDEEDDLFTDNSVDDKDESDFSLDDLLAMETDLTALDDEQSEEDSLSQSDDILAEELVLNNDFDGDSASKSQLDELTESTENSDFAFAVDNNKPAISKKMMVSVAALVAVIGIASAGAWYFLSNGKSANKVDFADKSTTSDFDLDLEDIVPDEKNLTTNIPVSENIASKPETQKPVQETKTPQQPPQVAPAVKPIPEQLTMQKIKKDFSQPNTYLSVSKIVWDVPEYLTYNDDFSKYLQTLGSSVKLNLSSDLLLVSENTLFNKVKVKVQLKDSGRKFSAELVDGCGAQIVDNLVLQSVKNTLNQLQPPVNSLDTADEDLFVTIYL